MKFLLTLCFLTAFSLLSFGAGECLIVTSDGKRITTSSVTAKPSSWKNNKLFGTVSNLF